MPASGEYVMSCSCQQGAPEYQSFPVRGTLSGRVNLTLPGFPDQALPSRQWPPGRVFTYVLSTLDVQAGRFIQYGGAPNFQGDCITLCTCMRMHRTWAGIKEGVWVAGLCSSKCPGGNQLFYLMKVERIFSNFERLWKTLPAQTLKAKSATRSVFGDFYEPKKSPVSNDWHDPDAYVTPRWGHKHHSVKTADAWKKDVMLYEGKEAKLLLGEPINSFLWESPRYVYNGIKHPRFKFYDSLTDFYKQLKEIT